MLNNSRRLERIAILSVHTSPLHQPGTGDSGGMNVYISETSKRIAQRGIEVEIFTRATSPKDDERIELAPGVTVRNIAAGPFEGLRKEDLPAQLCAVTAGVLRAEAAKREGFYDLLHSNYWLSGQVGWIAQERWGVPLVHTMHTMARVKNLNLAEGDTPEPNIREIGEEQVVEAADRLVANTEAEANELINLYSADPARVRVVNPGVDLDNFVPGSKSDARHELG
ncbi:MAG: D-inositol-3-phosphate glycosyltransferase MshA, partial [Actinomycetota bacterium]